MSKITVLLTLLGMLGLVMGYGVYVPCPSHPDGHIRPSEPLPSSTTILPLESETRAASEWRDPRDPDGDSIIGIAGVDYPILASIPRTNFICSAPATDRVSRYYADPEAFCQVFHVCLETGGYISFLCPNGTVFNDLYSVCDWWYNVKCGVDADDATTVSAPVTDEEVIDVTSVVPPLVELQPQGGRASTNFFRRPLFSQAHL